MSDTDEGRRPTDGTQRARRGAPEGSEDPAELARLHEEARLLDEEVASLRRKVADGPKRVRALEERLLETKGQLAQAVAQNEKLSYTLREAREHIAALRDEVDKLTRPPSAYGVVVGKNEDGTVDVLSVGPQDAGQHAPRHRGRRARPRRGGRPQRELQHHPRPGAGAQRRGGLGAGGHGGRRAGDRRRAGPTRSGCARWPMPSAACTSAPATRCSWTAGPGCCSRSCPGPRSRTSCWRRCPTSPTSDIGGLDTQIEEIADAVELPFLHQELFAEHRLPAPKGILLYGPPGLRQDAHRQGGGQQPGQEGRGQDRRREGPQLLHQHQGPRAAQQVRRRDRAPDPPGVPAGPGEERGGLAGHRLLRRDGLDVPHPRLGHQLRHGVDHRAAALGRDRRRGGPAQRHRDRGHQPGGPDRPGHPPPRPPRREDQDRAAQRATRPARSSRSTCRRRSRCRPRRWPRWVVATPRPRCRR